MKENPREGQKWMEQWTIILTIPMAVFRQLARSNLHPAGWRGQSDHYGLIRDVTCSNAGNTVVSMVAGTMFGIWLGQLISEYGIPNQGLSLIIFAGIVARIPTNLFSVLLDQQNGWWLFILIVTILVLTIFAIVSSNRDGAMCRCSSPAAGWATACPCRCAAICP